MVRTYFPTVPNQSMLGYQSFNEETANMTRLTPHESPDQDIVLLGHSMGGILTAEVVLLPLWNLGTATRLKHRVSHQTVAWCLAVVLICGVLSRLWEH